MEERHVVNSRYTAWESKNVVIYVPDESDIIIFLERFCSFIDLLIKLINN